MHNRATLPITDIIKIVMSSASEADFDVLFVNALEGEVMQKI